jgi:hypothetical protein
VTDLGVADMLLGLYEAAGRKVSPVTAEVYGTVLARFDDETGKEAGRRLWGHVSWEHPPSPGMVREEAQRILRAKSVECRAIPQTGRTDANIARARIAEMSELLAERISL